MNIIQKEPALITGFIAAVIAVLVAFGAHITDTQVGSIMALVAALLPIIAAFVVRQAVTPNADVQATFSGGATSNATAAVKAAAPTVGK